jgi:nucleoid DNA-binding protein
MMFEFNRTKINKNLCFISFFVFSQHKPALVLIISMNNSAIFSRLIKSLLLRHNRVSLPGMGSFITENQHSALLDNGRLISPPGRGILFSVNETWNDELLERAYAAELEGAMLELDEGIDSPEQQEEKNRETSRIFLIQAKKEVTQFVALVNSQLQTNAIFHFPGLGSMKMEGKRMEITFAKSADCDLDPDDFGLTPIPIKPLSSPSTLMIEPKFPQKSPKSKEPKEPKQPKKSVPKWRYLLLVALVVVIIGLLLVYIFREELRPWLEPLLYTPEQRQWLNVQ